MKPEPFLYRATCELLGADGSNYFGNDSVVMVGDSEKCDRDGPAAEGIQGYLLNHRGGRDFTNLTDFADHVLIYNECQGEPK
ncbi:hypothetical protein PSE10B_53780 [Pseudomonas amygdali pv. eriobotryae]|nr:hypothetical protein ALQ39_200114 [Pseudomonas amygdali pv. eriobotryae]GFZ62826.1 hypothetical protein PSE10A_53370 [Pseudomonas amygdali pv. eriobotryae]GFZ68856.1 hypothetical protein PSE10B_53780 [Pseudomonas amygdali pv. eriobotryae]GFZ74783.1 hypothetical protein PSE10C_55250 [Pseudomonas amygdali pv. eriobotryae]